MLRLVEVVMKIMLFGENFDIGFVAKMVHKVRNYTSLSRVLAKNFVFRFEISFNGKQQSGFLNPECLKLTLLCDENGALSLKQNSWNF